MTNDDRTTNDPAPNDPAPNGPPSNDRASTDTGRDPALTPEHQPEEAWAPATTSDPHRQQQQPLPVPDGPDTTGQADQDAPGRYIDDTTGPIPEPNEPA